MTDEVVIAVDESNAEFVESFMTFDRYQKNVAQGKVFFHIPDILWAGEYDEYFRYFESNLTQLGHDNYAFVRIGNEVNDNEIHGNISNFGIKFRRSIDY